MKENDSIVDLKTYANVIFLKLEEVGISKGAKYKVLLPLMTQTELYTIQKSLEKKLESSEYSYLLDRQSIYLDVDASGDIYVKKEKA